MHSMNSCSVSPPIWTAAGSRTPLWARQAVRASSNDAFDATPVIVGNDLYLRGHRFLYRVTQKSG